MFKPSTHGINGYFNWQQETALLALSDSLFV